MPKRRLLTYCVIIVIGVAILGLWRSSHPSSFLEPGFRSGHTKAGEGLGAGRKQHFKPTFLDHVSMNLEPEQQRKALIDEKQQTKLSDRRKKPSSNEEQPMKVMSYVVDKEPPTKKIPSLNTPQTVNSNSQGNLFNFEHTLARKSKPSDTKNRLKNRFGKQANSTTNSEFIKKGHKLSNDKPPSHKTMSGVYPFQDTNLPWERRVKDLVTRLTLNEIVGQMAHGGAEKNGPAPSIARLGIKPYQWGTECISGNVWAGPATSFPMPIGMSATFNYELVYKVAMATSNEVRAANNDYVSRDVYTFHTGLSCWSPVVNILRDPRWGRNQETYGEDPWLSGYLARAFVTGLQGNHSRYVEVNAGCKHFDVHGGPEKGRYSFDAKVSERDWHMTFLPQFKACVDAGAWSIMCSYNRINGIPACANKKLLTDILRKEWQFKGYVVSDQGALERIQDSHHYTSSMVETAAAAVNAGTCLEDGDNWDNVFSYIGEASRQGLIQKATLVDAVSRLFMVRMRLGEFDPPELNPYKRLNVSDFVQSDAHRALSLRAALESFVLLKNDREKGLPLKSPTQSACVVGPFSDNSKFYFGHYSPKIMTEYVVTPLQGIKGEKKFIAQRQINSASGCKDASCKSYNSKDVIDACSGAGLAVVCLGTGAKIEREHYDRSDINLPGSQLQLLKDAVDSVRGYTVLVLYSASPVDISWAKENGKVVAILQNFFPGQSAGTALARVLTGKYNPAGRLPYTWPASLHQIPPITDYTMVNRTYRYFSAEPLYPFGYGLSYTEFKYSNLKVIPHTGIVTHGRNVTIRVSVTNVGNFSGDEVIQVYISWPEDYRAIAPIRQLVGVKRVHIRLGRTVNLKFVITSEQRRLYTERWEVVPGMMQVCVGGQQPMQKTRAPSNILQSSFTVRGD